MAGAKYNSRQCVGKLLLTFIVSQNFVLLSNYTSVFFKVLISWNSSE